MTFQRFRFELFPRLISGKHPRFYRPCVKTQSTEDRLYSVAIIEILFVGSGVLYAHFYVITK